MAKFVNSSESISSSLLLWNDRPTQVSIEETYDLKVWPVTNIFNEGPINFNLPPQPKGMMTDIHVITKLKIQLDGQDITERQKSVSVVNNFTNSLWGMVDVQVDDRLDITQSMKNSYAYQTYFNHSLNSDSNRAEYLYYNELFKMDEGVTKQFEEESRTFWVWSKEHDDRIKRMVPSSITGAERTKKENELKESFFQYDIRTGDDILNTALDILGYTGDDLIAKKAEMKEIYQSSWVPASMNPAASERSRQVYRGKSITLCAKLQCPLFNTAKCLPTNMKIRISLTKNNDKFLLLADEDSKYSVMIEDCYLTITYYKPRDEILSLIEERLRKDPASYFISRPEIIIKPITNAGRIIRMTDIFHQTLPPYAFFCLQRSKDFEGSLKTNPFTFVPFKKFQFYLNGSPYFMDPLEVSTISKIGEGNYLFEDFGDYLRQLYITIGKDLKGDCLINSSNFQLNFMVGMSFGADRSSLGESHLNLQEKASSYLEIDMGINESDIPNDMILIVYALYDRQIQIDSNRKVRIIE